MRLAMLSQHVLVGHREAVVMMRDEPRQHDLDNVEPCVGDLDGCAFHFSSPVRSDNGTVGAPGGRVASPFPPAGVTITKRKSAPLQDAPLCFDQGSSSKSRRPLPLFRRQSDQGCSGLFVLGGSGRFQSIRARQISLTTNPRSPSKASIDHVAHLFSLKSAKPVRPVCGVSS